MSKGAMTDKILIDWLDAALNIGILDVYQTHQPNVFYVTFSRLLTIHEIDVLYSLDLSPKLSPLKDRYMITFEPSPDGEE